MLRPGPRVVVGIFECRNPTRSWRGDQRSSARYIIVRLMERIAELEVMDDEEQARGYAKADFSEGHNRFVALFRDIFPDTSPGDVALDLGCGAADVTIRFARALPAVRVVGIDAAEAMLAIARDAIAAQPELDGRIRLVRGHLPEAALEAQAYDIILSNSLLHHLVDPHTMWRAAQHYGKPGAPVFVMDLRRTESREEARRLVARYTQPTDAPVLINDFYNSLISAYTPEEIRAQLDEAGLNHFTVQPLMDLVFGLVLVML